MEGKGFEIVSFQRAVKVGWNFATHASYAFSQVLGHVSKACSQIGTTQEL